MMAVISLLSRADSISAIAVPHVLGLKVQRGKREIEVDLGVVLADERPLVILGEAKSYWDSIDSADLANLGELQSDLLMQGILALVCVATLRDAFDPDEIAAIRQWSEKGRLLAVDKHERMPNLPIALTGRDLSLPSDHDDHPLRWRGGITSVRSMAGESCRRNVGLTGVEWRRDGNDDYTLRWC
jgi:hypothetical protein